MFITAILVMLSCISLELVMSDNVHIHLHLQQIGQEQDGRYSRYLVTSRVRPGGRDQTLAMAQICFLIASYNFP